MNDRFLTVARQVQASYRFHDATTLILFIVGNMHATFGTWYRNMARANKRALVSQVLAIINEEAL